MNKSTKALRTFGMFGLIGLIGLSTSALSASPSTPSSFWKAKKLMYESVYLGHNDTFYCGCAYSGKNVDLNSCGYEVRKNAKRANRTEAEHVVPAYWIAHLTKSGRACWAKGTKLKGTSGRKYCEKNNPKFKEAHNDLMNLVPAIGEINGDRSNYKFTIIDNKQNGSYGSYGACKFYIYKNPVTRKRFVEPPRNVKGDVARIYFYMKNKYKLEYSPETFYLMRYWNAIDPMDDWERERIKRIEKIQGRYTSQCKNDI